MKSLVISSTLLLAFVVLANANPRHSMPPHKRAAMDTCFKKLDLTEDKLDGSAGESVEMKKKRSCFWACVNKELGVITAEGNIDKEAAMGNFLRFMSQDIRTGAVDACYQTKGADDCETAQLFHACVMKFARDQPLNPELRKKHNYCKAKLNLTGDTYEEMKYSSKKTEKDCLNFCLGNILGFLKDDGSFDKKAFIENSSEDKKEIAQKMADDCGNEVAADECEAGNLVKKCFMKSDFIAAYHFHPPPPRSTQD